MRSLFLGIVTLVLLTGCRSDPDWANKEALIIGAPRLNASEIGERQTDVFANTSEQRLLIEASQVLQDLGFTIEESAPRYGVLAGSKDRDATETGQVTAQVALAIGMALIGARYDPVWDRDQVIRATITTSPVGSNEARLRVSFERIITNNKGLSRVEELSEPEFSKGFFEKIHSGLAMNA